MDRDITIVGPTTVVTIDFDTFMDLCKFASCGECETNDIVTIASELFNRIGYPDRPRFSGAAESIKCEDRTDWRKRRLAEVQSQ